MLAGKGVIATSQGQSIARAAYDNTMAKEWESIKIIRQNNGNA